MMKFGNASWGFRETPLEKQLEITQKMGLSVLELGIANAPKDVPLEASIEDLDRIKELYSQYGIELLCAATGNDFSDGNQTDVKKVKQVIDICAYLGIAILRIFAGFSPADDLTSVRWEQMIDSLNQCAEYAKDKKVTLTIETHGGVNGYEDGVEHFHSASTRPELLSKLLKEINPSVCVNYDPANLRAVGIQNPTEVFLKIQERVAAVHLKDFAILPSGHMKPAACGEGDIDWKNVMESLEDFEGPVLFEYENVEDVEAGLRRCYQYIAPYIRK